MLTPAHDPPMLTSNRNGRIAFGVSPVGVLASPEIATPLAPITCLQRDKSHMG